VLLNAAAILSSYGVLSRRQPVSFVDSNLLGCSRHRYPQGKLE